MVDFVNIPQGRLPSINIVRQRAWLGTAFYPENGYLRNTWLFMRGLCNDLQLMMIRNFFIGFLLALVCSCADQQLNSSTQAPTYTQQEEATYEARRALYRSGLRDIPLKDRYDPLESVPGVTKVQPLAQASAAKISPAAARAAIEYTKKRKSSALLVWVDGSLEIEQYFGNFSRETPLVSKAMAKPLAAIAIGRAIHLGTVDSLDQPAADFIREWQGDAQKSQITIRHLLEMRSGLLPQDFGPQSPEILDRAYLHPRHDSVLIHDYPVTDTPGERYEYSNANYELIALIIERATGRRYAEFLGNELLVPLGAAGGSIWIDRPGGLAHTGCCLLLPAESFLRIGRLLVSGGQWEGQQLLAADFVADMRTGTLQNPHFGTGLWVAGPYVERRGYLNPSIPLGKVLHSEPYLDAQLSLFDGNGNQVMYLIPSQNTVILRMGEFPSAELEWDNSYLPNLLISDHVQQTSGTLPTPQRR